MKQRTGNPPAPGGFVAAWDGSRDYIRVMLQDLETEARVGVHAWEQHPERPTRLIVNVEMFAHTKDRLGASAPENIIDYDLIRDALKQWPLRPHTLLLETLVEELVQMCFDIRAVEACRVSIVKPDIFNEAAGAGVEVYRLRPIHNETE
ncbi:MAG TPA: dihydroneopterin aldolase [Stellaceae bacterium]|nr:dihydroneopterin aldolase [Stellaceae bacterium]